MDFTIEECKKEILRVTHVKIFADCEFICYFGTEIATENRGDRLYAVAVVVQNVNADFFRLFLLDSQILLDRCVFEENSVSLIVILERGVRINVVRMAF